MTCRLFIHSRHSSINDCHILTWNPFTSGWYIFPSNLSTYNHCLHDHSVSQHQRTYTSSFILSTQCRDWIHGTRSLENLGSPHIYRRRVFVPRIQLAVSELGLDEHAKQFILVLGLPRWFNEPPTSLSASPTELRSKDGFVENDAMMFTPLCTYVGSFDL